MPIAMAAGRGKLARRDRKCRASSESDNNRKLAGPISIRFTGRLPSTNNATVRVPPHSIPRNRRLYARAMVCFIRGNHFLTQPFFKARKRLWRRVGGLLSFLGSQRAAGKMPAEDLGS